VLDEVLLDILWPSDPSLLGDDVDEGYTAGERDLLIFVMEQYGLLTRLYSRERSKGRRVWLVPPLLHGITAPLVPDPPVKGASGGRCRTCILHFDLVQGTMGVCYDASVVPLSQLARGFLPEGLFVRVVGKCVAWCQKTSGENFTVRDGYARFFFGNAEVALTAEPDVNAIRLDVGPDNPLGILGRVERLVSDAIREFMRDQLTFTVLVPRFDIGTVALSSATGEGDYEHSFVTLRALEAASRDHGEGGLAKLGDVAHFRPWIPSFGKPDRCVALLHNRYISDSGVGALAYTIMPHSACPRSLAK
jgi:hypothetical protein